MDNSFAFRIYLARPMVFYTDPESIFSEMKDICTEFDMVGFAPIDGQIDLSGIEPGRPLYNKIVSADFALMDGCDAGIVCLDPFHGRVEMDAAKEISYLLQITEKGSEPPEKRA